MFSFLLLSYRFLNLMFPVLLGQLASILAFQVSMARLKQIRAK